ncbi:MAG: hypothetical protein MK207_13165 [Saprospiraceae bacterium]|nr:hypothetical protein [Saprospiraceae bacterium]
MRICILLVLFNFSVFAQEDYTFNSSYRTFEVGESFFIFFDNTPIYPSPYITPNPLVELSIGHSITILERIDEAIEINGFRTNWYHVSFLTEGNEQFGFVWGGNIARHAFYSLDSPKTLFFYGIEKIETIDRGNYKEESIILNLIAYDHGFVIDQLKFQAIGTLYTNTQGNALGNKGIYSIQDVIEIAFNDGYCGGVSASITIFWDGKKLHYIDLLTNSFNSETFASKFFVYPVDKYGKEQFITLREESGIYGQDNHPVYTYLIDKLYKWDGVILRRHK